MIVDAQDLRSAVQFVKKSRRCPSEVRVTIKGWVRIKRDILQLSRVQPTPYSRIEPDMKWAWHSHREMMKVAPINVLGVPVKRVDHP